MDFNLNAASEKSKGPVYQRPGIEDNVKISKVSIEETGLNKVKYLQLETTNSRGEIGKSTRMFLGTEVKPGKKCSGWSISARNLVDLLMVTHNVDEDTAKGMINIEGGSEQEKLNKLVNKVSALLVGKPFRAKFRGEETRSGAIIAEIGAVESMNVENTRLKYDASRDIKKYEGTGTSATTQPVTEDLPF